MTAAPTAVVLLSGGLDSATALAVARREGFACHALSFDYGQRHRGEVAAAARIAAALGAVSHRVARIDLRAFGGSALTSGMPVPKDRPDLAAAGEIPTTYVPARNTIFLAFGLAAAETVGARDLYIGVSAVDYSGYPDCRPEFIEAFARLAALATRSGVEGTPIRIQAPLLRLGKAETIRLGRSLGVDYGLTRSCYDPGPGDRPCGSCDSCRLRAAGFREAGEPDPAAFAAG